MAEDKKRKSSGKDYPMHPNYGKITRYQDVPITVPEQRQFRQPGQTLHVDGGETTSS